MFKSYGKFWKNYVNFEGKSNRPDYWFAFLMNTLIILIGLILLGLGISSSGNVNVHGSYFNFESSGLNAFASCMLALLVIFVVATIIPDISITVRRLRDAGYHWAFIFLELIPWIGKIVLIVLLCMPTSEDDINMFTAHKRVNPDELEKWYKLKEEGVITPEEYETKKKDLL